jgi:tetratricopeptide (TPR) repeat protein
MSARLASLPATLIAIAAMSAAALPAAADPSDPASGANTNTVIGPNVMLSDGATALMNGQWERGIQLTQLGLSGAISPGDRAAAFANLCAGYAALKRFERALENCNQSLALNEQNWRAWQNRAATYLGLGKVDESMRDIQRGLQLNPDSQDLQKTLALVRDYEKRQQERMQHLLES